MNWFARSFPLLGLTPYLFMYRSEKGFKMKVIAYSCASKYESQYDTIYSHATLNDDKITFYLHKKFIAAISSIEYYFYL